ncbi:MAG: shikimate kinase [Lautropia sp.]|nr:shikimate kinase [Lautropia sp.]
MKAAFSIFLVGMMGAGKSTVGVRLARRLNRIFIDADRELEERLGVSVPTVFELEGEDGFRRRETQLLQELCARDGLVLATGGGAVLSPHNRKTLSTFGEVIYLQASPADLWQRLRRDRHRPLLRTPNPRERIYQLTREREPFYLEVADHIITTSRQPIDQIVEAIVQVLQDNTGISAEDQANQPADPLVLPPSDAQS